MEQHLITLGLRPDEALIIRAGDEGATIDIFDGGVMHVEGLTRIGQIPDAHRDAVIAALDAKAAAEAAEAGS